MFVIHFSQNYYRDFFTSFRLFFQLEIYRSSQFMIIVIFKSFINFYQQAINFTISHQMIFNCLYRLLNLIFDFDFYFTKEEKFYLLQILKDLILIQFITFCLYFHSYVRFSYVKPIMVKKHLEFGFFILIIMIQRDNIYPLQFFIGYNPLLITQSFILFNQ